MSDQQRHLNASARQEELEALETFAARAEASAGLVHAMIDRWLPRDAGAGHEDAHANKQQSAATGIAAMYGSNKNSKDGKSAVLSGKGSVAAGRLHRSILAGSRRKQDAEQDDCVNAIQSKPDDDDDEDAGKGASVSKSFKSASVLSQSKVSKSVGGRPRPADALAKYLNRAAGKRKG